ncbi:MAG: hypothetical protein ACRDTM_00045 [Micromonosporaceae bacterium]
MTRHLLADGCQVRAHFRIVHAMLFEALTPEERAGLELGLGGLVRAPGQLRGTRR